MTDLTYWRYVVTGVDDVWTDVVLRSDGWFATTTPFKRRGGGYAAFLSAFPGTDFRAFFVGLNAEQVHSYIASGEDVFDGDATIAAIKEKFGPLGVRLDRLALDELEETFLQAEECVWDWAREWPSVASEDLAGCFRTKPEPQSWAFCTRILPVLQQMIRDELAAEAGL